MPRRAQRGGISREDLPVGYAIIMANNLKALGFPGDECLLNDEQVRDVKDALRTGNDIPGGYFEPDPWRMRALLNINGIKDALDGQELDDAVNDILAADVEADISEAWAVPAAPSFAGSSTTTVPQPGQPAPPLLPLPSGVDKKKKHSKYGKEGIDWDTNLPNLPNTAEWDDVKTKVSSHGFQIAGNLVGPCPTNKSSKTIAQWRYPVECREHTGCGMHWMLTRAPPFDASQPWVCRERVRDKEWDGVLHWGLELPEGGEGKTRGGGGETGGSERKTGGGAGKTGGEMEMETVQVEHTTFETEQTMAVYMSSTFQHSEIKDALTLAAAESGQPRLKNFSAAAAQQKACDTDALKLATYYFTVSKTTMLTTPKALRIEALTTAILKPTKKKRKKAAS